MHDCIDPSPASAQPLELQSCSNSTVCWICWLPQELVRSLGWRRTSPALAWYLVLWSALPHPQAAVMSHSCLPLGCWSHFTFWQYVLNSIAQHLYCSSHETSSHLRQLSRILASVSASGRYGFQVSTQHQGSLALGSRKVLNTQHQAQNLLTSKISTPVKLDRGSVWHGPHVGSNKLRSPRFSCTRGLWSQVCYYPNPPPYADSDTNPYTHTQKTSNVRNLH